MDKNIIKKFAVNARNKLRNSVKVELNNLGISADGIDNELSISTQDKKYYFDENHPVEGIQIKWRQDIVRELNNRGYKENGKQVFNDFVEEVAYTWFNRIIAIRFMEVNNYIPSRVRVLSNEEDKNEPEIMDQALLIEDDLGGYSDKERELINQALDTKAPNLMDDLYAMLFIKQCNALENILPGLFEKTRDYLQLLFVPHYSRGIIQELVNEIPESYFDVSQEGQVQIIGWLYQYYNAEPHEKVVKMNGKAIQKDEIPAATQLFTPDWIVRYMVDNSLGKYYLERHQDSVIKSDLKYLLPDELHYVDDSKDISEYKLIDNAMGSGHILIYAFDLFMKMYIEAGYSKRDAVSNIMENNIFGLEIDKRAYQLSYFALMMKGREYDRRFFRREPKNNLYFFEDINVPAHFYEQIEDEQDKMALQDLLKPFSDATELGSIVKVNNKYDIDHLKEVISSLNFDDGLDLYGYGELQDKIIKALNIIKVMTNKYEVAVTNPPYMNKFDSILKKYLKTNYKDYSKDLFSVFVYHNSNMLTEGGFAGFMTPLVWMFIKSYELLRKDIITDLKIDSLIQMEYSAFEEATVPIDTFVLKKNDAKLGTYLRLSDFKGGMKIQNQKVLKAISDPSVNYLYHTNQDNFRKIPGNPIAYWVSDEIIDCFSNFKLLKEYAEPRQGMATSNNKKFLRFWYEIDRYKNKTTLKWFPYNKGGTYRKWYGNNELVINWQNNGKEIIELAAKLYKSPTRTIKNIPYYFREGLTWSALSSGNISFRYTPKGFLFDTKGPMIFIDNFKNDINYMSLIGYLNSNVVTNFLKILAPTLDFNQGPLRRIPISSSIFKNIRVINMSEENINLSRQDWDAFETSWDFKRSPLISQDSASLTLKSAYQNWAKEAEDRFNQLKFNEEELNKIFINLYGLQDELTPEEEDKDVSVRKADQLRDIKAFLSYFIGCVFGRYSIDEDGLIYAGGEWNLDKYRTFKPNKDNIILFTDRNYFNDDRDIIVRLKEFLINIYKPDSLSENMDFIAQTLDPKKFEKDEGSEQIIRNYFINDFYKDHDKIYQKRPIYWEFSSGRNKGFKALMYLHRYSEDELAMVRTYLHDLQPAMQDLINIDQKLLDQASTAHEKSQYRRTITAVNKQLNELIQYDQVLDHLSQNPVDLDLDDGVLVNHEKLQQGEKLLTKL